MVHINDTPAPAGPILLIMGSTRASRLCPQITAWVESVGQNESALPLEIVDLATWHLPMDDEPGIPAGGHYSQPHTKAWSEKILSAGAIVFVTPQYNWGYPAVLKNAIDHLYLEWRDKAAMIVSYGGHGGGKSAEQLKQVAGAIKLQIVPTMPALTLPDDVIRKGAALDPKVDFADQADAVAQAFRELSTLTASR